ncbi:amidohydrolase family protein [Pseudonocardia acaciae]|uniref:amidohydrolase family protein n=1 Tax=Pseudonocardia acaciae TaxID=551276 RepID=UPI0004913D77|nr:amidohydrolase family protein [Pseudonocardia acaciae]
MTARVVDLCGYVLPAAELLYERGDGPLRGHWSRLEAHLEPTAVTPGVGDWTRPYLRFVRDAGPALPRPPAGRDDVEPGVLHDNPSGRLRALDRVGIDVQFIHPGPGVDAVSSLGVDVAVALLAAYNRYVTTYCEADPDRLKAVVQVLGAEPAWSASEIRDLAADPSVAGVTVHLPVDVSPDHRNFDGVWDALEQTGLPLVYRPGSAARLWAPPRLASYLHHTGVLDRWPGVRMILVHAPVGESYGRLLWAVPTVDLADPAGLLWASHFPFDDPRHTADQIRRARRGDGHGRVDPWTGVSGAVRSPSPGG